MHIVEAVEGVALNGSPDLGAGHLPEVRLSPRAVAPISDRSEIAGLFRLLFFVYSRRPARG
ncbi:hypothetical protein [Thiocapsa sp.]|uniref:hypothetical protein n=1 Tax=Thiocapsa sp. TaxID=2024551 RepID=UPI0025D67C05|nr:hypothetical protein [Thiocapsa sp.]